MRESILTIPISEIMDDESGCPICSMRNMLEKRTVEYIMGAAMMEPDVRIETNKLGFCHTHFEMMKKQKNRLSLALMLQTHLDEVNKAVFSGKRLFEPKNAKQKKLGEVNGSCFVCSKVDWGMERLMKTFFECYRDPEFKKRLVSEKYICLTHYEMLMNIAPNYLQKGELDAFLAELRNLTGNYIKTLYEDVSHYCEMYDYRNSGNGADWGNAKDSIERAIQFLTSREAE